MELTPDYIKEQNDCVKRNLASYKLNRFDLNTKKRLLALKNFCSGAQASLSVGSGGFEPVFINSTHACDVTHVSALYLNEQGYKGKFFVSSCDDIKSPDNSFDVAVCSEVIEHLPTIEAVKKTFLELDRVAYDWLVTTPTRDVHEPTHKFIFSLEDLERATCDIPSPRRIHIIQQGLYFYITNNSEKLNCTLFR